MLQLGQQIPAGLGFATVYGSLDFETYSEAGFVWQPDGRKWKCLPGAAQGRKGLPIVGAAVYSQHQTAEVLSLSYDLRGFGGIEGMQRWRPSMPSPVSLFAYLAAGGILSAWNCAFELWIWNEVCVRRYGWPPLDPRQVVDAMAKARAHALPGSLDDAGRVSGSYAQKDPEGKRLIKKFTMPRDPTKTDPRLRIEPELDPEGEKFWAYNDQDVRVETEVGCRVPEMSPTEMRYWRNDQAINRRGVMIDLPAVNSCIAIIEQATVRYTAELEAIAGCAPSEIQQLQGWLHAHGVHLDSLDEETIEWALDKLPMPPHCRRALEIRQIVGSASVKKVFAMRNQAARGDRLHDLYTWHGARTGRPTGNGPQPTNLPKAGPDVHRCGWLDGKPTAIGGCGKHHGGHVYTCPWCGKTRAPDKPTEWSPEAMEDALEVIMPGSLELLQWFFGDAMLTIAGCLRGLFIAAPGMQLISSDYSAIEAVVIAALAGEEWRLDVFRTHGRIYEVSASKIFKVPFEAFAQYRRDNNGRHHPLRAIGKIAELALGFMGWINAWKQFDGPGTDDEIKANIIGWREASPAIVNFAGGQKIKNPDGWGWIDKMFGLEGAAVSAVLQPGQIFSARGIRYLMHGDVLYCRLLSGRLITYHHPRLEESIEAWRGLGLSFEGWNTNPKSGPVGWQRMNTYSGKLAENVVQATARDIQMNAIEHLELAGYTIVLHTYDEVVAEVPKGWGSIEELERIMATLPDWAAGWPIKVAGGWAAGRYRKQ